MLSIFGDFGDQKTYDPPPPKKKKKRKKSN